MTRSEQQAVVERFLVALRTGQLQELLEVLAPDVVLVADGGGIVPATLAPVRGAGAVAELLARAGRPVAAFEATGVWLNGAPAALVEVDGVRGALSPVVEDGRVAMLYVVRNPRKLTRLDVPTRLTR